VVLNTSFNLRGEPIVHRPAEAVADFLASDMDALFLGSLLATKPDR
jgi:carbamoyltransferase